MTAFAPPTRAPATGRDRLAVLRRFYVSESLGGESLFDVWERGEAWGDSVTPSTFSPAYRSFMVTTLERCLASAGGASLLSIGCGNAVVEAELAERGRHVLAVDALPEAVALAHRKGVGAVTADAADWTPPIRDWHVAYADGFLGHIYAGDEACETMLRRMSSWLVPRGVMVISNDAVSDVAGIRKAPGVPGFHWLSAERISHWLRAAGNEVCAVESFVYERPLSGPRLRAVIIARRRN